MKILIIGCNGFIGSALFSYFGHDNEVYGIDTFKGLYENTVVDSIKPDFSGIFISNKFDLCVNCAGSANVQKSFTDPFLDFKLNTEIVAHVLSSINLFNSDCRFINISSAAVYGNPNVIPISVGDYEIPISPYGSHKRISEILISDYARIFGLKSISLRVFSAYGIGQKKLLFWDLYNKFVSNPEEKVIELFGTGFETRDFIYIDDIAQQIALIIKCADFKGEIYNIANGIEVSIRELAITMRDYLQSDKEILFQELNRLGDPLNWCADISNLIEWGYRQSVPLHHGIELYCKWLKNLVDD